MGCCAVPASCKFQSAKNMTNNVSVTVELSGEPQPLFSAAHPWHQQQSDTAGRAVATRPRGFSGSSTQLIGHLTQVITSRRNETLSNECKMYIGKYAYRDQDNGNQ